jgi:hypothetical protein
MPVELKHLNKYSPPTIAGTVLATECYLCGATDKLTVEHVTPKIMFKPHSPGEYVKLTSCSPCNSAKALEDEYILRYIQGTSFVPEARECWLQGIRGFERRVTTLMNKQPGQGLRQDMINRLDRVPMKSDGGIILGNGSVMKMDSRRLDEYMVNLAKGLLVRNTMQNYDWGEYEFTVSIQQLIQKPSRDNPAEGISLHSNVEDVKKLFMFADEPFKGIWERGQYGQYWQNIFSYAGSCTEGMDASIWLMILYGSYAVGVCINNKSFDPL